MTALLGGEDVVLIRSINPAMIASAPSILWLSNRGKTRQGLVLLIFRPEESLLLSSPALEGSGAVEESSRAGIE